MSKRKVIVVAGTATIGNVFGSYGHTIPAGKFAVCRNGEYSNGGHGPIQAAPACLYDTRDEAQHAADAANAA